MRVTKKRKPSKMEEILRNTFDNTSEEADIERKIYYENPLVKRKGKYTTIYAQTLSAKQFGILTKELVKDTSDLLKEMGATKEQIDEFWRRINEGWQPRQATRMSRSMNHFVTQFEGVRVPWNEKDRARVTAAVKSGDLSADVVCLSPKVTAIQAQFSAEERALMVAVNEYMNQYSTLEELNLELQPAGIGLADSQFVFAFIDNKALDTIAAYLGLAQRTERRKHILDTLRGIVDKEYSIEIEVDRTAAAAKIQDEKRRRNAGGVWKRIERVRPFLLDERSKPSRGMWFGIAHNLWSLMRKSMNAEELTEALSYNTIYMLQHNNTATSLQLVLKDVARGTKQKTEVDVTYLLMNVYQSDLVERGRSKAEDRLQADLMILKSASVVKRYTFKMANRKNYLEFMLY